MIDYLVKILIPPIYRNQIIYYPIIHVFPLSLRENINNLYHPNYSIRHLHWMMHDYVQDPSKQISLIHALYRLNFLNHQVFQILNWLQKNLSHDNQMTHSMHALIWP
jgi:hypothetical protein